MCWLVSVARSWGPGTLRPLRWLPLVLALPAAVHAGADLYHFHQPYDPTSHPLPNIDSLRAELRVIDSLEALEPSPEAAELNQ
ncbi:hypothetical protein SAMN04487998_1555 [Hymenobacter actinosclerus]|uniref:Uncharacterized protein n=1 Tax=Hymenobacter actinosclerus TaxID=82805 RepID=A0A1I0DV40_9BACT|nr:hypothetical protein SAMN04487998_1555 [Hymenobacter actinosclerus]